MDKLLSDFRDSIFTDAFNSYGGDIIETGVDSLLGDGLLKDVPVINTIMGVIKTVLSIRERMFLKNTIVFCHHLIMGQQSLIKLMHTKQNYLMMLRPRKKWKEWCCY